MSVKEIGTKLVALCREDKNLECIDSLYAEDVESIEAGETQGGFARVTRGKGAVRAKNVKWGDEQESTRRRWRGRIRTATTGSRCASLTTSPQGERQRFLMDEVAVFTVKNQKIVKEEFFYDMGG